MAAEGKRGERTSSVLADQRDDVSSVAQGQEGPARAARLVAGAAARRRPGRNRGPAGTRATELELENQQLRRLVTDLLLEKLRLEEALQARRPALKSVRE